MTTATWRERSDTSDFQKMFDLANEVADSSRANVDQAKAARAAIRALKPVLFNNSVSDTEMFYARTRFVSFKMTL